MDIIKALAVAGCFLAVIILGQFIALFITALNDAQQNAEPHAD